MASEDADRARAKRQACREPSGSAYALSQQRQGHAATCAEYGERCHDDQHGVPSLDDAQLDSSSQHRDVPDSQEGLASELADLCTFKSAGSGARMRINSPSSVAQVPPPGCRPSTSLVCSSQRPLQHSEWHSVWQPDLA